MTLSPKLQMRLWVNRLKDYKEIKASEDIKTGIQPKIVLIIPYLSPPPSIFIFYFFLEMHFQFQKAIQPIMDRAGGMNHPVDIPNIFFKIIGVLTISSDYTVKFTF